MERPSHATDEALAGAEPSAPGDGTARSQSSAARATPPVFGAAAANQLLGVRLGVANALFTSLRLKHADTAAHSIRVALDVAAWALSMGMSTEQRDIIELAALFHDIGKIGVPDRLLLKPGPLTPDEMSLMERHRVMGVEILRASCSSEDVLVLIASAGAWFDGGNSITPIAGTDIPLGARMLAVADAFDSMVSDQVYRRAYPHERAIAELYESAGSQFDPELVALFVKLHESNLSALRDEVTGRWSQPLVPEQANSFWQLNVHTAGEPRELVPEALFRERLMDNMRDAAVFVDNTLRILFWNPGAERLTGLSASTIQQHRFSPSLFDMRDADGIVLLDDECPLATAVRTGEQRLRRYTIRGRGEKDVSAPCGPCDRQRRNHLWGGHAHA